MIYQMFQWSFRILDWIQKSYNFHPLKQIYFTSEILSLRSVMIFEEFLECCKILPFSFHYRFFRAPTVIEWFERFPIINNEWVIRTWEKNFILLWYIFFLIRAIRNSLTFFYLRNYWLGWALWIGFFWVAKTFVQLILINIWGAEYSINVSITNFRLQIMR